MGYADARDVIMCEVECQGKPALFSELRLDRKTIHRALHVYEVRHADDDCLKPASVERQVLVNFRGTLITTRPLDLGTEGCYLLKEGFQFKRSNASTHDEFCSRYRIKEKARDSHER